MLQNIKKAHKKKKKKDKAPVFNFSALHLIHDPQDLAEKLFWKLETLTEKFEVKLMLLELVSRLIGTHQLIILNFYPYIARFLAPHQREVVRLLQFSAQACHDLVPPESVEPVLRAIVNNFITERNSSEVMAVGLNAVREMCSRAPLVMSEDLLRDLAEYKTYKDKGVMMASRSLIQLFRSTNPELLHKKDRGRPTEAVVTMKRKGYGEGDIFEAVPGAEVLDVEEPEIEPEEPTKLSGKRKRGDDDEDEDEDMEEDEDEEDEGIHLSLEEKQEKARAVTLARVLTDEDFKRIDAAQLRKQVTGVRKGKKRKVEEDVDETPGGRDELVSLENIEMIYGRKKNDKEARMEAILKGREGREKFGRGKTKLNEHASTSNKQKNKAKNFSMLKHKYKNKVKRSFRHKQMDLQKRLIKQQKFQCS
jgi:protein SDA1